VFSPDSNTRVMLLSPLQRDAFVRYYPGCDSRISLVPPGVELDRRPTDAAPVIRKQLRQEFNLDDNDLLVVQIGSGFRVKGVDRSLRAIASLPASLRQRTTYLLIGQDKPRRFRRLANKLGIADRIRILSGRDDIPRFLQGADLLLHPAYSESAGYTLLEATIAGLPVLATATCGYAFHVEKAGSGLICKEPFSQDDLNNKLLHMLTSAERESWQRNGIAYGRQDELFSLASVAVDQLEQLGTQAAE
jgi:UDP-glucose:(heptosyl)LPS alpha-1,3-glucosyltransferase